MSGVREAASPPATMVMVPPPLPVDVVAGGYSHPPVDVIGGCFLLGAGGGGVVGLCPRPLNLEPRWPQNPSRGIQDGPKTPQLELSWPPQARTWHQHGCK